MMIFLSILKICGIVLLSLLGMIVFILLLALFFPVRYRLSGSYHSALELSVRVRWLFGLITFRLIKNSESDEMYVRIAGIKKKLSGTAPGKNTDIEDTVPEARQPEPDSELAITAMEVDKAESVNETPELDKAGSADTRSEVDAAKDVSTDSRRRELKGKKKRSKNKSREKDKNNKKEPLLHGLIQKVKDIPQKIADTIKKISDALHNIKSTSEKIVKLLGDPGSHEAFRSLGKKLIRFLRFVMPRKLKLALTYSTGSADTTGQLLGVFSCFPIGYRNRWNITPDFMADRFYADADFQVVGSIFLFQIVGILLGVLLDKNCRRLYNKLKNFKNGG